MALGIVSSRIQRGPGGRGTVIDGLPVILKAGAVRFVDGGKSSDGPGLSYGDAHNTIQHAVDKSGQDDTILIRPRPLGSYYTESVIVPPTTHRGLSILGTGHGRGGSVYQACTWRNSSNSVDDAALEARAGHMNIENVHFFSRAGQALGWAIKAYWNTGFGLNIGSGIVNCGFSGDLADHPAPAGVVQSAIRFDSSEGQLVEDCVFVDCRVAIAAGSTMNAWKELLIRRCLFNGLPANIAADIMLADGLNFALEDCTFGHTVPSNAAGTMAKYVFVIGGATVEGSATGNRFASANAGYGTDNTASNIKRSGNFYAGGVMTS